jgi:hypothetical protein
MKTWKNAHWKKGGAKATGLFSYLNEAESLLSLKCNIKTIDDALNLKNLDEALAVRALFKIKRTMDQI